MTDVLGIEQYENLLAVDPQLRAISPMVIDEHLVDEERTEGLLLGDRAVSLSPEAEHLVEDLDARLYGTTDLRGAAHGQRDHAGMVDLIWTGLTLDVSHTCTLVSDVDQRSGQES